MFAIITGGNIEWTLKLPATIIALGLARLSIIGALKLNQIQRQTIAYFFPKDIGLYMYSV